MPFVDGVYRPPLGLVTSGIWLAILKDLANGINFLAATQISRTFMINGTFEAAVDSDALTISIKTLAGTDPTASDPVLFVFRNDIVASATYETITLDAAASITVSSGSTLGTTNSTAFRIWLVAFNDNGTLRLGVINCRSGNSVYPLSAWGIASSTAEGGAGGADSAQVFYTDSVVTSKAYATLGYLTWESGLTTAGTWSAGPTRGQLYSPDVPLPGREVQSNISFTGTLATNSPTQVPFDNTPPTTSEGFQVLTLSMTPTSAANLMAVRSQIQLTWNANGQMSMSLYRDAVTTSVATSATTEQDGGGSLRTMHLEYSVLSGTTSSTTFNVRTGLNNVGTVSFNGASGNAIYGGVLNSYIRIAEMMA